MEEIVNRVANSKLITFNLEDFYQDGKRIELDVAQWLHEGFILKEKDFRKCLKSYNWEQFQDTYVAVYCSTDAILPSWAIMLVTTYLTAYAKEVVYGNLQQLETVVYTKALEQIDFSKYQDQLVIIKGCSNKPVPENAYILATQKLQPYVKSLMFGEACSSVPLYKQKK